MLHNLSLCLFPYLSKWSLSWYFSVPRKGTLIMRPKPSSGDPAPGGSEKSPAAICYSQQGLHCAILGIRRLGSTKCSRQSVPTDGSEPGTHAISCPVIPNRDLGQTKGTQQSRVADHEEELERRVEGACPQGGLLLALKHQREREVVSTFLPLPRHTSSGSLTKPGGLRAGRTSPSPHYPGWREGVASHPMGTDPLPRLKAATRAFRAATQTGWKAANFILISLEESAVVGGHQKEGPPLALSDKPGKQFFIFSCKILLNCKIFK